MSKNPKNFTDEDFNNYEDLMIMTNNLYHGNDPKSNHPKASKHFKWKYLLSQIWFKKKGFSEEDAIRMSKDKNYKKRMIRKASRAKRAKRYYEGSGVVVIPSDPNALLERLDLLLTSQEAGHTGVRNELVSICDELKRQGVLDTKAYKKLNSNIKK